MKGVYNKTEPVRLNTVLVFDSPHSGRGYPKDFHYSCDFNNLRQSEDLMVDRLYAPIIKKGYPFLTASFPRSYIDVNRPSRKINAHILEDFQHDEINVVKEAHDTGLIRRHCSYHFQTPIYKTPVTFKDMFNRVSGYYNPYHNALKSMLDHTYNQMGGYIYISCHSMPSTFRDGHKNPYDITLGSNGGLRCAPELLKALADLFQSKGYNVGLNIDGFKGGYMIRKYGEPAHNKHAILIEINRALYADETSLTLHNGSEKMQKDLLEIMIQFDRIATKFVKPFVNPARRPQR